MRRINNTDISLIQKKIDGDLSPGEEEKFNTLIKTSVEAQKYYFELLGVHSLLTEDSEKIKKIDITEQVFSSIENKRLKNKKSGVYIFISNYKKQIISYAAIFIIGIISGYIVNQIAGGNNIADSKQISGTFLNNPEADYSFNKNGTEIRAQQFENRDFNLYTISVKSSDLLNILINNNAQKITNENINVISANGEFNYVETSNNEIKYLSKGEIIFQIITTNELRNTKILFSKEGLSIYEIIIE